jgi:hypothetical protein
MRPFTRTAYMPRTYFAKYKLINLNAAVEMYVHTCSLPSGYPTRFWLDGGDDSVKVGRCTDTNAIGRAFHLENCWVNLGENGSFTDLHQRFTVWTSIFPEIKWVLNDGT